MCARFVVVHVWERAWRRLDLRSQRLRETLLDAVPVANGQHTREVIGFHRRLDECWSLQSMEQRSHLTGSFHLGDQLGLAKAARFGDRDEVDTRFRVTRL